MDLATFSRRALAARDRLYRVAIAILGCEADAEDAAQEALVRAWRHLPSLKEESYFETWLVRILINECKRALRRRALRPAARVNDLAAKSPPENPALREALDNLDARYRLPVVLHCAEGYSLAETARLLRLSRGAAKWRVSKGVALLREALKEKKQ